MRNEEVLQTILSELREKLKTVYGQDLYKVILYGSYARGDFDEESDIDVIALVDSSDELIKSRDTAVNIISSRISLEYDITVSINVKNRNFFNYWKEHMPYFKNIAVEGIEVGA